MINPPNWDANAPFALALFQKRPSRNTDTTGGAMKPKTNCRYSHKEENFSIWGAQAAASITRITVAICPEVTKFLLERLGFNFKMKSIVINVDAEFKVAEILEDMAANKPAMTKPKTPTGSRL